MIITYLKIISIYFLFVIITNHLGLEKISEGKNQCSGILNLFILALSAILSKFLTSQTYLKLIKIVAKKSMLG